MNPQLAPESLDRALVAPTVQSDFGHQPPPSISTFAVADYDPCRLKDGCCLLAYGTMCGQFCWARITER